MTLFLEVVNHEESVEIEQIRDPSGAIVQSKPIEGTRTAFLHLRAPNGTMVRAEIPPERLDEFLALMMPEDFDPLPVRP